jgi:hypothetical protein
MGICCGNSGELTRAMAETMGRSPPASKYRNVKQFGTVVQQLLDAAKLL